MRSNNFDINVPVTMCHEVEAQTKNYYCCEPILKKKFAWSIGMKRVIFGTYDFLAPVNFWSIFLDLNDRKMAGSKKVVLTKNQFFHDRELIEICFY